MFPLLSDKQRTDNPVTDESEDLGKSILIDKNKSDLVPFPTNLDRVFIEINIFDIYIAQFRNTDACGIDRPDNEFITRIINRINQTQHLIMFQVFYILLLDTRPVNTYQWI